MRSDALIDPYFTHEALLYACCVMITHLQYVGQVHVSPGTKILVGAE